MILETHHIEKSFGQYKALDDINIAVREGVVFGLLGPNGAGKTTLIRLINRIALPDGGEIVLGGQPLTDEAVRRIGYLPEERGLYKKMRVGEQALYLAQLKGLSRADATRRLREWFEKFQIADWWNRPVEQLSKGMQQKVQFIVTVLHEPQLLIFDEPFSGFDPVNATLLKNEILELRRKGATVILSTHNMASVEELCDDIALINKSKVVLHGSIQSIRRAHRKNSYLVETLSGNTPLTLPSSYAIERQSAEDVAETFLITPPPDISANELLQEIIHQREVVSFHEVLPTMNDIFIETVINTSRKDANQRSES